MTASAASPACDFVSATTAAMIVADEAHFARREYRAIERGRHHCEALERRQTEIVATAVVHTDDSGHRRRATDVDRYHIAVRDRRTHVAHIQHAGLDDVIDVLALAGEQRRVLEAQNCIAQDRTGNGHIETPRLRMLRSPAPVAKSPTPAVIVTRDPGCVKNPRAGFEIRSPAIACAQCR